MPLYQYTCENCGAMIEDFRPMSRRKELPFCKCGVLMARDVSGGVRSRNAAFHTPIEMYSIAPETSEQRDQLAAVGATFNRAGVPLARDRAEKNRLMKVAGVVEMS